MAHDRDVGGIRCLQVLEHLAEYLDDEVPEDVRKRIEAHLQGCDWCERFGGGYTSMVTSLRRTLCAPDPLESGIRDRLTHRLSEMLTQDD